MNTFEPENDPFEQAQPQKRVIKFTDVNGKIEDLDLDKELYVQYAKAKNLQEATELDEATPLGQKVTANNSIVAILEKIVKTRTDLYNAQTVARIESILIQTLKDFPEVKEQFLKAYRKNLDV